MNGLVRSNPNIDIAVLVDAGFQRVGTWRLTPDTEGIELDFTSSRDPGVYAYVVGDSVHYVGSAQRGLHNRFRRYAIAKTLRTSARIRSEIIECLIDGRPVEIYALSPPDMLWNGLPVDLIAGLEEGLIRRLRPPWNRRSNRDDL